MSVMREDWKVDIEDYTDGHISNIYYCPPNENRKPVLLLEMNQIKKYRRIWLDQPVNTDDWTWFKPEDAIKLIFLRKIRRSKWLV